MTALAILEAIEKRIQSSESGPEPTAELGPIARQVGRDIAALHLVGEPGRDQAQQTRAEYEARLASIKPEAPQPEAFYRAVLWTIAELLGGYEEALDHDEVVERRGGVCRDRVLEVLDARYPGRVRPGELCRELSMNKSQVSRALRDLEANGQARWRSDPEGDRRHRYWMKTPPGVESLPDCWLDAAKQHSEIRFRAVPYSDEALNELDCVVRSDSDFESLASLQSVA